MSNQLDSGEHVGVQRWWQGEPSLAPVEDLAPLGRYVFVIAGCTSALLAAFSGRYGYHRDELYFLAAGQHLAWGYPDQPPFVPLLARLLSAIAPDSIAVLRLPSAAAAGGVVVLTALLTRELGGRQAAQVLAAGTIAVSGLVLAAGHFLNTTVFNLLVWTLLVWLIVRILRTQDPRLWLLVGALAGIGLLNSDLAVFLVAALVIGIAIAGPRRVFRSPWLWAGGVVALALWAPYLIWQWRHGWPQLAVSQSIAAGNSGTSTPRILLLPEQLVLLSPYLAPIWIVGLIRLFREPALQWSRAVAWAYVLLAAVFIATGGKAYYLASMLPVLVAAGAQPAVDWLQRGRTGLRRGGLVGAFAVTLVSTVLFTLPLLPVTTVHTTPIIGVNYDEGETIGWPTFVDQIAAVFDHLPASQRSATSILASNYGEAGAVDRYGPAHGLPQAFSGQDGFWYWEPPPSTSHTFVAVGFDQRRLARFFDDCRLIAHLDNRVKVDDQEQGKPVWICGGLRGGWSELWPQFRSV